jgi:hypothetical protein
MPELIVKTIGFQGIGIRYPEYAGEHPLIHLGHVGLQFPDYDLRIFGLHPAPSVAVPLFKAGTLLKTLRSRKPLPGTVQDDTDIFHRAFELARQGEPGQLKGRLIVYDISERFEESTYSKIRRQLEQWYNEETTFGYVLPPVPDEEGNDNCASWPRHLGVNCYLDEHRGFMNEYVSKVFTVLGQPWDAV